MPHYQLPGTRKEQLRPAPLVRCPSLEDQRPQALALQVEKSCVTNSPVGWHEGTSFEEDAHRYVLAHIPLATEVGPDREVEHECKSS